MATDPLAILSVADMRGELRDAEADASNVTQAIRGAVSHVQKRTGLPLLRVEETQQIILPTYPGGRDYSIRFYAPSITSVTAITYWLTTQTFDEEPAGTIDVSTLGRLVVEPAYLIDPSGYAVQYPPADGWPEMLFNRCSQMLFTVRREFTIDDESEALKSAIILVARNLYLGYRESLDGNETFEALLDPWI